MGRNLWNYFGAIYLVFQSLAATLWWFILLFDNQARTYFRPSNCSDEVLLAFVLPDAILFVGAALWAARKMLKSPRQAVVPLSLYVGASVYAALFCLMQWILTGEAFLAALLMAPCLVVGPFLLWKVVKSRG